MLRKVGLTSLVTLLTVFGSQALTISGSVTDAAGNTAVVGAIVTFQTIGGNVYSDTTVAPGAYQLPTVRTGASGVLTVTAAGFLRDQQLLEDLPDKDTTINISLTPAGVGAGVKKILGTVTEAGGANAVAGAQLILLLHAGIATATPVDTVLSANDGKYRFDSLASGVYDIVVTKAGFLDNASTTFLNLNNVDSLVASIQLTPVGNRVGTLTGMVTATDTTVPLANAEVLLTRTTVVGGGVTTTDIDSVQTNASGVYTISGVPAAAGYSLTVSAAGYVPAASPAMFRVDSAVTRTENFRLAAVVVPAGIVNGAVTDSASLAAIQGALVVLRRLQAGIAWVRTDSTVTAANGSFAFMGLGAGTYSLVVSKAGYTAYTSPGNRSINLITNPDTGTVAVALSAIPKGNLRVFVEDSVNDAVSGASVSMIQRTAAGQTPQTYNGITAADGWVTFSAIVAGAYDVTVSKSGFNTVTRANQAVTAYGSDTTRVTLQTATGATKTVKGTVKTAAGAGIGGSVVVLTAREGGGTTLALIDTCAGDGSYRITGIPAGYATAGLLVTKTGFQTGDSTGISIAGDSTTVDIVLVPVMGVKTAMSVAAARLSVTLSGKGVLLTGVRAGEPVEVTLYSVNGQVVMSRVVLSGASKLMIPKTWSDQIMFLKVEQGGAIVSRMVPVR
jgi:hypothetical protein